MKKFATIGFIVFLLAIGFSRFSNAVLNTPFSVARDAYESQGKVSSAVLSEDMLGMQAGALVCALRGGASCTANEARQGAYFEQSIMGRVNQGITLAFNYRPASVPSYIAYVKDHLGVKAAYAQGIGFSGLEPVLEIWKAFRNISYAFLILVMVAIGFMILFRMKIDPRTVISIQSALPRVVIALLLITFSYAIVGLMIDLMYLIIYVSILALGKTNPIIFQNFSGGAITNLIGTVFTTGRESVDSIAQFLGLGTSTQTITAVITAVVGGAITLNPLVFLGGLGLAILPQLLLQLLVTISILFMMARIFFMLLSAWIQIVIAVIFAPLQLMFGAIPGVNAFGGWFKNLIANLAVFPITVILLLISTVLGHNAQQGSLWTPPGLGGTTGNAVAGLIGLAMIMIIPNIVGALKEVLKTRPMIPAGPGAILSPITSIGSTGLQALSTQYYLSHGPIGSMISKVGSWTGLRKSSGGP